MADDDNVVILPARVEVTPPSRGEELERRVEALEIQVAEMVRREQRRVALDAERSGQ